MDQRRRKRPRAPDQIVIALDRSDQPRSQLEKESSEFPAEIEAGPNPALILCGGGVAIVIVVMVMVLIVFVIVQMLADESHFIRQGLFHDPGLAFSASDTAHIRRVDA
jgi:hypothetical protein